MAKPRTYSVAALARYLHRSHARTQALIAQAGIALAPRPLHYTDERPRTRRTPRPLTTQEAERVIALVRLKEGRRASRG